MRELLNQPYVLLRALEWVFGLLIVVLVACAFALGWFGSVLDNVASWYSNVFTASFDVREVHRPPDTAFEGYVPGYGIFTPGTEHVR